MLIAGMVMAQVAIGKSGVTKVLDGIMPNPSISLEFYDSTDNKKGMRLPWVMAYDTTAHQLAIFNGTVWSFWKP